MSKLNFEFDKCRCQTVRKCYTEMWEQLWGPEEVKCIEDASPGTSTNLVFLYALSTYCPDIINITMENYTREDRNLYEVIINRKLADEKEEKDKPVIVIDAGQQASIPPVMFALYIIQCLVACSDLRDMIQNVKWVILPSANPDGMEFSRADNEGWKKNIVHDDILSNGVDISRNFDHKWSSCPVVHGMSEIYPGEKPFSEAESTFVKYILNKYKSHLKAYVSLRRDGHGIFYPYGHGKDKPKNLDTLTKVADTISAKVNQKAGGVQTFLNHSIFEHNGGPYCGNSVDYAIDMNIPLAFEMRVFMGKDEEMISAFHSLPKGFDGTLRSGYFSGIKELFYMVSEPAKYKLKI